MHYVYLIRSMKNSNTYIGCTSDLKRRILEHNRGSEKSTKSDKPWEIVYYEAYKDPKHAHNREKKLKHYGQGLRRLKERLDL